MSSVEQSIQVPTVYKLRKARVKMTPEKKEDIMKKGVEAYKLSDADFKSFGDVKGLQLTFAIKKKLQEKYPNISKEYKGQEISVIASALLKSSKGKELKAAKPKVSKKKESKSPEPEEKGLTEEELEEVIDKADLTKQIEALQAKLAKK